jgi:hypothetical protein
MYVKVNPLTPELFRCFLGLPEDGWERPQLKRHFAERGWGEVG